MRRKNDAVPRTYFRSERVFFTNGKWYFATREGDLGPFANRELAKRALSRFVEEKVELGEFQKSRELGPRLTTLEDADRGRRLAHAASGRDRVVPEVLI